MPIHNPIITVIVPVYNVEPYIERFISSLDISLHEARTDAVEVIIINDGSTDRSAEILSQYIKSHGLSQVKLITQANGGVSNARNRGMAEAHGTWLMFLDSDDYITPDYIGEYLAAAHDADNDVAMICGGLTEIDDNGDKSVFCPPTATAEKSILLYMPMFSVAKLWRADIIKDNRLTFDSEMRGGGEDSHFLFKYLSVSRGSIKTLHDTGYMYCRRQSSLSRTPYTNYAAKLAIYRKFRASILTCVKTRRFDNDVWAHWRKMLGYDLYDMIGDLRKEGYRFIGVSSRLKHDFDPDELDDLHFFQCSRIRKILNYLLLTAVKLRR